MGLRGSKFQETIAPILKVKTIHVSYRFILILKSNLELRTQGSLNEPNSSERQALPRREEPVATLVPGIFLLSSAYRRMWYPMSFRLSSMCG